MTWRQVERMGLLVAELGAYSDPTSQPFGTFLIWDFLLNGHWLRRKPVGIGFLRL